MSIFLIKICSCGHLINYESTSCPNCGKGKNEPIRYCNCGAKIDNNSNYCENCGEHCDICQNGIGCVQCYKGYYLKIIS